MTKFIEVHRNGASYLINLAHVEDVECDTDGNCTIYFAFSVPYPNAIVQDSIMPDETYDQIKRKIFGGEWSWNENGTEYDITDLVTHWQPMPQPPKGE